MERNFLLADFPYSIPKLTAIIGGGGKTTLLYKFSSHLAETGNSVLVTTTTHLAWPPGAGMNFISPKSAAELKNTAVKGQIVLAGYPAENERMTGLRPELLKEAAEYFDFIVYEADGSRHMPLKYHRSGEPPLAENTGLVMQVAGLSALDRPAGEVLHGQAVSEFSEKQIITEENITELVLRGFKCGGASCPAVCLLNQADLPGLALRGEQTAKIIRSAGYPCAVGSLEKGEIGCWC